MYGGVAPGVNNYMLVKEEKKTTCKVKSQAKCHIDCFGLGHFFADRKTNVFLQIKSFDKN